jgi:murein DD-endopeptidase MepM/ murein hydrolase activator NlpD
MSIKDIMIDLIADQRVEKRQYPESHTRRGKVSKKPSGSSITMMPQRPARIRRVRKKKTKKRSLFHRGPVCPGLFEPLASRPSRFKASPASWIKTLKVRFKGRKKKAGAFSPVPLLVLTGITGVLVLQGILINGEFFPKEEAIRPAGGMLRQQLASYAGFRAEPRSEGEDAIPLDLIESFSWESYTVKEGDSISKISGDRAISMDAIIALNGITNARRLRAGDLIRIPNMDGIPYTVKPEDTLSRISSSLGVPLEAILDANDIQSDSISPGTVLFIPGARMKPEDLKLALGDFFIYPIRGQLTSPFGWRNDPISGVRRYHAALDLAAPTGAPIKAAMDGKIATVGLNSVYGRYIIISHSGGFQTMYAHMSLTSVRQGASVRQGQKIGEVGNTGYSTGPHLHFAVFKNGKAVNPLEFLH